MFLSRAIGPCARTLSLRPATGRLQWQAVRLARAPCLRTRIPAHQARGENTLARHPRHEPKNTYPPALNVFHAGQPPILFLGFARIACIAVFAYGFFIVTPSILLNPDAPSLWALVIVVGSAIPMLATGFAFGGYVHNINVILPAFARRSKQDLMRFAEKFPASTKLELKCMWLLPWPQTTTVFFEDLRRLPMSWHRLANLEHVPIYNRKQAEKNPMWNWLAKSVMGRYMVSKSQLVDRSRVPGVWEKVWEQIPMAGQEKVGAAAKRANVPADVSKRPVVLPPGKGKRGASSRR